MPRHPRFSTNHALPLLAVVGSLLLGGVARADPPPPTGVVILSPAAAPGSVSPDGRSFVFWSRELALMLGPTSAGARFQVVARSTCGRDCDGLEVGAQLEWSPDSTRLAYATNDGLFILDVASRRARRLAPGPLRNEPMFGFDGRGVLHYSVGTALWRDGGTSPTTALSPAGRHRLVRRPNGGTSPRLVVLSAEEGPPHDVLLRISVTDVETGRTRSVFPPRTAGPNAYEAVLSPAHDRVCYTGDAIRCVEIATGTETTLSGSGSWRAAVGDGQSPFSPSGRRLVYPVSAGGGVSLAMYSFEAGTSRIVVPNLKHATALFQDESHVVLAAQNAAAPALVRVDVETLASTVLVPNPTERYRKLTFVPGQPGVIFVRRERDSLYDLARIQVRGAIAR